MSKRSKACDISSTVRNTVLKRDNYSCIICGRYEVQIAHYVSRARGGLGIPENLVCLCPQCHYQYDNGRLHNEIKKVIEDYLRQHYPNWDNKKLFYSKWGNEIV